MLRKEFIVWALLAFPLSPIPREIGDRDQPRRIAPAVEMNLKHIDQATAHSANANHVPWSDIGWKANNGLVNERYLDPEYRARGSLGEKQSYTQERSVDRLLALPPGPGRDAWIARLSPAEKYDLIVGSVHGGLAEHIDGFLRQSVGGDGTFPTWWGLCEGSAPASMYYPEPANSVMVRAGAYRLDVPFYPSDIKALATMIWSRFNEQLDLPEAGGQCTRSGEGCEDNNPGTFHAALHHFLERAPGILVAEVDPTPVVWNFPVVGFTESYFNPQTKQAVGSLAEASVSREAWAADPRKGKRAPGTAYVVGVKTEFRYATNQPGTSPMKSTKRRVLSRTVSYELELGQDWKILGGEWLAGKHPDLLWAVPPGTVPDTVGDAMLPPGTEVNGEQLRAAAQASSARMVPLRYVVEQLVRRSAGLKKSSIGR